MALLDELKSEAERLRDAEMDEQASEKRQQTFYNERLKPCMLRILNYLIELQKQLKVVDPEVYVDYEMPGYGLFKGLRQGHYTVLADSNNQPRVIRFRFNCGTETEKQFSVSPKAKADETAEFLRTQKQEYSEWPVRNLEQEIVGLNFSAKLNFEVNFHFQVDLEMGKVHLISTNFSGFTTKRFTYHPDKIDESWLDKLGYYMLRKSEQLDELEISSADREQIRQQLEAAKLERDREVAEREEQERREQEEQERLRQERSLIGRLKKLKDKMP